MTSYVSGARFNEEKNKQDKTGLFILNLQILCTTRSPWIHRYAGIQMHGSHGHGGCLCVKAPSENSEMHFQNEKYFHGSVKSGGPRGKHPSLLEYVS